MTSEVHVSAHDLVGLRPDNLLAFLSLMGLLRALNTAAPDLAPAASWSGFGGQCSVRTRSSLGKSDLLHLADAGLLELRPNLAFGAKKDVSFSREEFRMLAASAVDDPISAGLLAALASDGVLSSSAKSETLRPSPLVLMFGQGHQHFLERLQRVFVETEDQPADERITRLDRALFREWEYRDDAISFRWDPIEDRRYALQAGDPSKQRYKIGTVAGANRLAAAAFPLFTTVPLGSDLGMVALRQDPRVRARFFCWPLPSIPTTLAGHRALLAHPALVDSNRTTELASYGVGAVARAMRAQAGKFFFVETATITPLV